MSLDGSGSSDADGDTLTYNWVFGSTPSGSGLTWADITGRSTATASFDPDAKGIYTLHLSVSDGTDSDSDTVDITITGIRQESRASRASTVSQNVQNLAAARRIRAC